MKMSLGRRGVNISPLCECYDQEVIEDVRATCFVECSWAQKVWQVSVFWECWGEFKSLQLWDVLTFMWQYKSGSLFFSFFSRVLIYLVEPK